MNDGTLEIVKVYVRCTLPLVYLTCCCLNPDELMRLLIVAVFTSYLHDPQ
jgi:hypothetical protein